MGSKRPWFCKLYQLESYTFTKDHENNGKFHGHICGNCLDKGKRLGHPEKDWLWSKNNKKTSSQLLRGQKTCEQFCTLSSFATVMH